MRLLPLAVVATLALSSTAEASCSRFSCFCLSKHLQPSSTGTAEATVVQVSGARTELVVQSTRGTSGGLKPGSAVTLPRERGDTSGARWLLFFADDDFRTRMEIGANGTVVCASLALSPQEAGDLFALGNCADALDARGYQQPCNDTVSGCECGTGPVEGAAWAVALLVLARRRPREKS